MKKVFIILFFILPITLFSQSKYDYIHFNKLTEVQGTEYVISSIENRGKMLETKGKHLMFINTKTGETSQVDFPGDGYIEKVEQVKIDSLNLNVIVVSAQTIDLNGKKGIDWNDPKQIIILSPDGKQRNQLTDDKFFVNTWIVNKQTGTIIITGYYDANDNNKYDKTDKNKIFIYNLKTLELVSEI